MVRMFVRCPMFRRVSLLLAGSLLIALFVGNLGAVDQANPPSEYQVKAAFIYNFAKFVEWPERVFASPETAITIGIVSDNKDTVDADLEETLAGKKINGRHLRKSHLSSPKDEKALEECHIVFIAKSKKGVQAEFLQALKDRSVLTITETDKNQGIINFIMEENKVRFEIDNTAAQQAGLKISSKLLSLARSR